MSEYLAVDSGGCLCMNNLHALVKRSGDVEQVCHGIKCKVPR